VNDIALAVRGFASPYEPFDDAFLTAVTVVHHAGAHAPVPGALRGTAPRQKRRARRDTRTVAVAGRRLRRRLGHGLRRLRFCLTFQTGWTWSAQPHWRHSGLQNGRYGGLGSPVRAADARASRTHSPAGRGPPRGRRRRTADRVSDLPGPGHANRHPAAADAVRGLRARMRRPRLDRRRGRAVSHSYGRSMGRR
jgi:hypothetical protein